MADGTLDCPDGVSRSSTFASLHDSAGHSRRRLTERCLAAIRHPLVAVITTRATSSGHRPAYDMDYDAIHAAAAETDGVMTARHPTSTATGLRRRRGRTLVETIATAPAPRSADDPRGRDRPPGWVETRVS
jgi:hypothetical protein